MSKQFRNAVVALLGTTLLALTGCANQTPEDGLAPDTATNEKIHRTLKQTTAPKGVMTFRYEEDDKGNVVADEKGNPIVNMLWMLASEKKDEEGNTIKNYVFVVLDETFSYDKNENIISKLKINNKHIFSDTDADEANKIAKEVKEKREAASDETLVAELVKDGQQDLLRKPNQDTFSINEMPADAQKKIRAALDVMGVDIFINHDEKPGEPRSDAVLRSLHKRLILNGIKIPF